MAQPSLLVVARSASRLDRFEQPSLRDARNIRDFLEQTGEYAQVTIFQLRSTEGPLREWVSLSEIER
ncbi:MAG: hypothetical protein ABSF83_06590 [Nitrososphaerales archaeon]|jgi:hypothetical protein